MAGIAPDRQWLPPGARCAPLVRPAIARTNGQRQAQLPARPVGDGGLGEGRLDRHVLVRLQARELEREHVRRLAGAHRRLAALLPGCLVLRLRLGARHQAGRDRHLAEADHQPGNGSVARQRKAVDGFEHLVAVGAPVAENLSEVEGHQGPVDDTAERRLAQRDEAREDLALGVGQDREHRHPVASGVIDHPGSKTRPSRELCRVAGTWPSTAANCRNVAGCGRSTLPASIFLIVSSETPEASTSSAWESRAAARRSLRVGMQAGRLPGGREYAWSVSDASASSGCRFGVFR